MKLVVRAGGDRTGGHQVAASADVPASATECESSGGGTRTPDSRIMIPHVNPENPGKYADFDQCAARRMGKRP